VFENLLAVHNGCIHGLAVIIQHNNTAAFPADILHDLIQDALKNGTQIERGRDLAANIIEKFK